MKTLVVTVLVSTVTAWVCTNLLSQSNEKGDSLALAEHPSLSSFDSFEGSSNKLHKKDSLLEKIADLERTQRTLRSSFASLEAQLEELRNQDLQSVQDSNLDDEDYALSESEIEEISFDDMETAFSFEDDDPVWQAEMRDSIAQVEDLIARLPIDSIELASYECRSVSCIVEFNFDNPETIYKIRPILIANGISHAKFKETEIEGQRKMIALYQR